MMTFAGPLLAIAGFVAYFAVALRFRVYRRIPWLFLGVTAAGAAIGLLEAVRRPGAGTAIAALVAIAVLAFASWYLFSYSMFARREDRPRVGDEFPDFTLPSSSGEPFRLRETRGQARVIILYRGDWCPFCQTELRDLRDHYRDIRARGARVIAISVDPPEVSAALRKKLGVDIEFVSDEQGTLMDVLHVRDRNGLPGMMAHGRPSRDVMLPTTFLLDEKDRIRWVYRPDTYRVRAAIEEVLRKIDQMEVVGKPRSRASGLPDRQGAGIAVRHASGETGA